MLPRALRNHALPRTWITCEPGWFGALSNVAIKYSAIIGPPRSGTTWLHKYLFSCTNIGVTYTKEINWFNVDTGQSNPRQKPAIEKHYREAMARADLRGDGLRPWEEERRDRFNMKTDQDYVRFFTDRFPPDQPIVDVSPGYSKLLVGGYERIQASFPNAKIIILVRNPVDKLWSFCARKTKHRNSDLEISDLYLKKLNNIQDPPKIVDMVYKDVRAVFPERQIYCLFTEDLFSPKQDQTLADLVDAMGGEIQPHEPFEFSANRGTYTPIPKDLRKKATSRYRATFEWARAHMGRLPDSWQQDLDAL